MAFVVALIAFGVTVALTILTLFGGMMSDNVGDNNSGSFITVFVVGTVISLLIAASHWLPHFGW